MDYNSAIERVYEHLENDRVDKAVMTCLRIARNLQDFLYAAVFLREMHPNNRECMRILYDDTNHLTEDALKFIYERSHEYWLDTHTLGFSLGRNEHGDNCNILAISVSEIDSDLDRWKGAIEDLQIPSSMGEFDTAAFTDRYRNEKAEIRLRMKAIQEVKQRIKTRCLNYAIRIERQLQGQRKSQSFLEKIQNEVNNYFKAHSEDVYTKLQKAAQLVDSNNPEDCSLLLTEVRRAMKASADALYPPGGGVQECSDGIKRSLNDEQYMNRLQEYITVEFAKTSSRDLLRAELSYLCVFARKLNDVASKGVHAAVSQEEAKQGLLGLYLFLYNVVSRLQIS